MKKLISALLCLILVISVMSMGAFAADGINVSVNGQLVQWTDASPFIDENNRTLVPLRAVADAMGLEVEWDGGARTATFSGDCYDYMGMPCEQDVIFTIGSNIMTTVLYTGYDLNPYIETFEMDTAPVIVNDRTYAPIRYLAEAFGMVVGWDGSTRTVTIDNAYVSKPYANFFDEDWAYILFDPSTGYEEGVTEIHPGSVAVNGISVIFEEHPELHMDGSLFSVKVYSYKQWEDGDTIDFVINVFGPDGSRSERTFKMVFDNSTGFFWPHAV